MNHLPGKTPASHYQRQQLVCLLESLTISQNASFTVCIDDDARLLQVQKN